MITFSLLSPYYKNTVQGARHALRAAVSGTGAALEALEGARGSGAGVGRAALPVEVGPVLFKLSFSSRVRFERIQRLGDLIKAPTGRRPGRPYGSPGCRRG